MTGGVFFRGSDVGVWDRWFLCGVCSGLRVEAVPKLRVVWCLSSLLEWVHQAGAAGTLGVSQVLWDD